MTLVDWSGGNWLPTTSWWGSPALIRTQTLLPHVILSPLILILPQVEEDHHQLSSRLGSRQTLLPHPWSLILDPWSWCLIFDPDPEKHCCLILPLPILILITLQPGADSIPLSPISCQAELLYFVPRTNRGWVLRIGLGNVNERRVQLIRLNEKLILPSSGYKWAGNEYSWGVYHSLTSCSASTVFQKLYQYCCVNILIRKSKINKHRLNSVFRAGGEEH